MQNRASKPIFNMLYLFIQFLSLFLILFSQLGAFPGPDLDLLGPNAIKHEFNGIPEELFTSTHRLQQFFYREKYFVEQLRKILHRKVIKYQATNNISIYVKGFEDIVRSKQNDHAFMHNPLNAYNLVRHAAIGWGVIMKIFQKEVEMHLLLKSEVPHTIASLLERRREQIPGRADFKGICSGLVRLFDVYHYDLDSFIENSTLRINDQTWTANVKLTNWDLVQIAGCGIDHQIYGGGIDIMLSTFEKIVKRLLNKIFNTPSTPPFVSWNWSIKSLEDMLQLAMGKHDYWMDVSGTRSRSQSTNNILYYNIPPPERMFQYDGPEVKSIHIEDKASIINDWRIRGTEQEAKQYLQLCRGHDLRPMNVTKNLYCKYESRNIPYYVYGPRKLEVVSLLPYIVIIYEFITHHEAEGGY